MEHPNYAESDVDLEGLDNKVFEAYQAYDLADQVLTNRHVAEQAKRGRAETEVFQESVPVIDLRPLNDLRQAYYFTLPKVFVEKAGIAKSDVVVYCRQTFRNQIEFLRNRVLDKNVKGTIVGPSGTGKSICTLAFMGSLDRNEWHVIWFHLADINYCLMLKPNTFLIGVSITERFDLPHPDKRKLFVCVDGFTADPFHKDFYNKLIFQLCDEDRIVFCSSLATLGKMSIADDIVQECEMFHLPSWTKEEFFVRNCQ